MHTRPFIATLLLAACAASAHGAEAAAPPARSGIGINVDGPKYWSTMWSFIDLFKQAEPWRTVCGASDPQCRDFAPGASARDTKEQARLDLDPHGWVKRLPAADDTEVKYRAVETLVFGSVQPAGRYVVLYDGRGTLEYGGIGRRDPAASRPGRDVLEVTAHGGGGLVLRITRIDRADPLRNIRVIGPGGVCADAPLRWVAEASACRRAQDFRSLETLHATQRFHPAYLHDLSGFRALRFMSWAHVNTSSLARWADRPQPDSATWTGPHGVPLEAMFELANATGADAWITLPLYADDDYVRRFAALARAQLEPPLALVVEYGNEPWNSAPPYGRAGALFEQQARALWPDARVTPLELRLNAYALRAAQMCRLVKAEFGAQAGRVRCVAGAQGAWERPAEIVLGCELARATLGRACAQEFDALAIAPYFGHYLTKEAHIRAVERWADAGPAGLDLLFRELTGRDAGGQPVEPPLHALDARAPARGALEAARHGMLANRKVADAFGVPVIAYEGGQHLVARRSDKLIEFFRAANRDPRMGAALQRHLQDWQEAGGQLYVAYSHIGRGSRFGHWGMKEWQGDEEAPKWRALVQARDQRCWWKDCAR